MQDRHTGPQGAMVRPSGTLSGAVLDPSAARVLRNTYMLLAMTVAFSAAAAVLAMVLRVPYLGLWMLLPFFGLLFAVERTKNSAWGLFWAFAFTGWMGFTLGPILGAYMAAGAGETIVLALGGTAVIFTGMSAYALITRRDFSFMTGFLLTGLIVAFVAGLANIFLQMPALHLAVSSIFLVLASLMVMWQTSAIIHGGERNYISATITLYVSIYNIFVSLLSLMGMGGDD